MKFSRLLPLLGMLFVLGYIPTATVFTTRFFLDHAPIDANFRMFGLTATTFLPISVFCLLAAMEFFSFRLAILFWQASHRAQVTVFVTLTMFVALQMLPVASMYLGARQTAYNAVVRDRNEHEEKLRAARLQDERQQQAVLGSGADDLARLERLRDDLGLEISAVRGQRARLLRIRPAARSFETTAEIERLTRELDERTAARKALDALITARTAGRAVHDGVTPAAAAALTERQSFTEFLTEQFWSLDAVISLLLSGVFPVAALAFGYIAVGAMPNTTPMVAFDLRRELEIGAARPEADHPAFAELLKSALTFYVVALRAGGDLADEAAILRLRDDRELDASKGFTDLKMQIDESRLSAEAKRELIAHVDRLQTEGFHHRHQPGRAA